MISLRDLFKKQTGLLRGWKGSYVINNFLQAAKLRKNRQLYRQHGVQKSIFAPLGSQDFADKPTGKLPWLDRPDALEKLTQHPDFQGFDAEAQQQIKNFVQQGYLILRGFYSPSEADRLNGEVDRLLAEKKTDFNYTGRKLMDAHRFSPLIEQDYFKNDKLLKLLSFLMGRPVVPFQTINFIRGSEQRAHSDSIHMSTQPPGYLVACWTALETVDHSNGPLFFYPGSHRLPYLTTQDYDSGNTRFFLGQNSNRRYEDKVAEVVTDKGLKKAHFHAEKGDILIWHANLLHGGEAISRAGATRRSMVAHYFCEGVICYHEISQRPAILTS